MLNDLYLSASTIEKAGFVERLDAAAAAGYDGIGLRPTHYRKAVAEGFSDADMRAMLADRGLELIELGFVAGWWEPGDPTLVHEAEIHRLKQTLGGRHMMLISGPLDQPLEVIAERFAGVCDRAAEHDLRVALECLPWTDTNDAATAGRILEIAGRSNGGIAFDFWHHIRGRGNDAMIRALRPEQIVTVQISDGRRQPVGTELEDTFNRRLLPGQGEFDVVGLLRMVEAMGVAAPLGVEVLSDELRALSSAESARLGAEATRAVLAQARA